MAQLINLMAIRPFMYKSKSYIKGEYFAAIEHDANSLITKRCAEAVTVEVPKPKEPESKPVPVSEFTGETKELKKVTRSKPKRK